MRFFGLFLFFIISITLYAEESFFKPNYSVYCSPTPTCGSNIVVYGFKIEL